MGRKKREKTIKRKGKNEKEQNEKNLNLETINSPETKGNNIKKTELKALDFINVLTREHLRDLLAEYESISYKHNEVLNFHEFLDSCQDLKKEEISRLEKLKKGFNDISKAKKEEFEPLKKGNRNTNLSTFRNKNVINKFERVDNIRHEGDEEVIRDSHKNNIDLSTYQMKYVISNSDKVDKIKCEVDEEAMLNSPKNYKGKLNLSAPLKKNVVSNPDKVDKIKNEVDKEVMFDLQNKKGKSNNLSALRKKNVISNLDKADNIKNEEVMLDSQNNKGKSNNLSALRKKNVISSPDKIDNIKYEVDKETIQELHRLNMNWFLAVTSYDLAGFNKYRFDQIPCVHESGGILEYSAPNRVLQETMLSLKMSEEFMIREYVKEKTVRILAFVMEEEREWLRIYLTIPKIYKHDKKKIELRLMETFITFYADDFDGKDYVFEMYNLANKVVPKTAFYQIEEKDSVIIYVQKKKLGLWKQFFAIKNQIKRDWEKEMKKVFFSLQPGALQQLEPLEFLWKIALILANCGTDFLNLPSDLNHVDKNFESLEQMIFFYKKMIATNNTLKALIYIIGGAILSKLMTSISSPNSRKPTKRKSLTQTEERELFQSINNIKSLWGKNYEKGSILFLENKYEKAYSFFCEDINNFDVPTVHMVRGACLFQMKRFKESIIDSIFTLRNIGPYHGYQSFILILQHRLISGYAITVIDQTISLEYNHNELKGNIVILRNLRKTGFFYLNNIFKSYSLIFQKKFKAAIPFLENAENIVFIRSKQTKTSVILLLLYFVCNYYEKVIPLGKLILEDDTIYRNLVFYLLGMSSYYLKDLAQASKYLEEVKIDELADRIRIKTIRELIYKANKMMENGDQDVDSYYNTILDLSKDNNELQAHALIKLGVLNFNKEKYEKGIEYVTCSIDLVGNTKNALLLRSFMYVKLGILNKADEDIKTVNELTETKDVCLIESFNISMN